MFLLILVYSTGLFGQSINSVQFPPALRWKQIETDRFILIFPEKLEAKAAALAPLLDSLYPPVEASLNTRVTKWPVVINNSLTISNGYVTAAPKHSQLYALPPQDGFNGTGDWLSSIWSHELRHIVQNEKMQRGFTEIAGVLAGEYGWSGMSHFALPRMFWEGDAVLTETLLSTSGRGRLPDFERGLRTNLLSGIRFNYNKSALGYNASYKDNVQSWYVTGYHFCTYLRKEYGIEAFNRIMEISADFSFAPLIVNIAVKNVTEKDISVVYEECMDELIVLWSRQLKNTPVTEAVHLRAGDENDITNYYPLGTMKSSGNITALKRSDNHRPRLIELLPDGSNKILKTINPSDGNISFNGTIFCWSEQKKDIRWGNRSWSVLRTYNPATEEYRLITDESRYFAPAVSGDGKIIAAVEYTEELDSAIVVIDSDSGKLLKRFPEPSGALAMQPCWNADGSSIIYIRQHNNSKSLLQLEYATGAVRRLTQSSTIDISSPSAGDGWAYYISSKSGIDQIYAVSLSEAESYEVTSRPFGTSSPVISGDLLLFSDYTPWGWALAETEILKDSWKAAGGIENTHVDYFDGLNKEEPFAGFLGPNTPAIGSGDYETADYWPISDFYNFHSTGLGISNSGTGIKLYLQANDILNLWSNQIYTGYDPQTEKFSAGISGAFAGLIPILLYGAEFITPISPFAASFNASLYGGAALPLDFSEGNVDHYLKFQSIFFMDLPLQQNAEVQTAVNSNLSWRYTEKSARKDILPPSGISFNARWYYSLNPNTYNFASGDAVLYFPGLVENHGISLEFEAEYNLDSGLRNFGAQKLPRGISTAGISFPLLFNARINYSLPAGYPDLSMGGFLYIPRIYLNIFCDAAAGITNPQQLFSGQDMEIMNTAGLELFADFHLFNNIIPLKTGLRFIYDFQNGLIRIEDTVLLFGFSLP